jgi:single-stranded DNA-binding protein
MINLETNSKTQWRKWRKHGIGYQKDIQKERQYMNVRNYGVSTGRLTRNPQIFENKDGSRKVLFTIAVQDNFHNRQNQKNSQFLPMEAFISKDSFAKNGLGVYALMHKGDKVTVQYTVKTPSFEKDGQTEYKVSLVPETIDLLESKSVTEARAAANAEAGAQAAPAVPVVAEDEELPFGQAQA